VVVARNCLVVGKGGGAMFVRSAVSAYLASLISVKPTPCVGSGVEPPSRRSLSHSRSRPRSMAACRSCSVSPRGSAAAGGGRL
jgi:hypothetical protein